MDGSLCLTNRGVRALLTVYITCDSDCACIPFTKRFNHMGLVPGNGSVVLRGQEHPVPNVSTSDIYISRF